MWANRSLSSQQRSPKGGGCERAPVAPNVLDRKFIVATPNRAWVGDVTYIATEEGWLFLAVVIDLFSRKVVGWSMRPDMQRNLVIDALVRCDKRKVSVGSCWL